MGLMQKNKFLTVYAVLDESTQKQIDNLVENFPDISNQIRDSIPYHITLGSFPLEDRSLLIEKIKNVCENNCTFPIKLKKLNHFDNKVLYIQPAKNKKLYELHRIFDCNYADGHSWKAHITIGYGEESTIKNAKKSISKIFKPISADITAVELGEFFPAEIVYTKYLNNL